MDGTDGDRAGIRHDHEDDKRYPAFSEIYVSKTSGRSSGGGIHSYESDRQRAGVGMGVYTGGTESHGAAGGTGEPTARNECVSCQQRNVYLFDPEYFVLTADTGQHDRTVIIGLFARNRFQFKNTTWKDWLRATLFPLTTIFCSVIFFQIYEVESNVGTELLLCEIILLFFDVMAMWILDYMDQQQAALQDNIILKRSIKQEKESMEALVEAYSDQRKKTHDFQNQLAVIYGLVQQESPNGEIIKYVEPLLKKELLPSLITKTGRNVVDILLTQKHSAAIKNQISFQMQLGDLSAFPLSDEELIVVLSNLLDNAFNACMAVSSFEERKVLLKMRTEEAAGFLYLENRTAHDVEILDNKIVAPKNKSIEHGYGLKNVAAILENINALYVFDYNSQKHLFSFSAQFPISR